MVINSRRVGKREGGVHRPDDPTHTLGARARLQLLGLSGSSRNGLLQLAEPERVVRPLDAYVQLVEALTWAQERK